MDCQAFHIGGARLDSELLVLIDQRQAVAKETGSSEHVAVAQALAFVHACHAHGEVSLPGVGVDGQLGDRLRAVEHQHHVAGDVVADLLVWDVFALLLHRRVSRG
ncbi:hypothetical protein D3C85_1615340 [compost metagenome]